MIRIRVYEDEKQESPKDGPNNILITSLEQFLEFIEEGFSYMGNDMYLSIHSADTEFTREQIAELYKRKLQGKTQFEL